MRETWVRATLLKRLNTEQLPAKKVREAKEGRAPGMGALGQAQVLPPRKLSR